MSERGESYSFNNNYDIKGLSFSTINIQVYNKPCQCRSSDNRGEDTTGD